MGVFADKKFEELDWVSQATEPIESRLNEILASTPDELILDFKTYVDICSESWGLDISLDRIIGHLIAQSPHKNLSYQQKSSLTHCFNFVSEGTPILDFEKQEIYGGSLKVIKTVFTMDEKVLEGLLGKEGIESVSMLYMGDACLTRCNEIMEILGNCDEGLRTRSGRNKRHALVLRLKKLFKDNEWKIKDTELANKVGTWIRLYIVDGNLAAYSNFCRLKVMTHKEQPIYSMEEIE